MKTTPEAQDGLISIPDSRPGSMGYRLLVAFVLLTSIGLVLGTAIIDVVNPLPKPKLMGAEKVERELQEKEAKWSDGSLARLIEDNYRITSRMRNGLAGPYATFLFRNLREGTKRVYVGTDGWMFMRSRVHMDPEISQLKIVGSSMMHAAISRRFATLGIRHILLPLPRKSSIFNRHLGIGLTSVPELDTQLIAAMEAAGVEAIDLYPSWSAWQGEAVYLRTDSHWSTNGVRIAAEQLATQSGLMIADAERVGEVVHGGRLPQPGGLFRIMNVEAGPGDEKYYETDSVQVLVGGRIPQDAGKEASLVVCGSSFSLFSELRGFLGYYTGKAVTLYPSPGAHPMKSILRMLDDRGEAGLPEILVEELPIHLILMWPPVRSTLGVRSDACKLLTMLKPPVTSTLDISSEAWTDKVSDGVKLTVKRGRYIGKVKPGFLARAGTGCAEVQLDVEVLEGDMQFKVVAGGRHLATQLSPGRQVLTLPIPSLEATSDQVGMALSCLPSTVTSSVIVHSMELVSAIDLSGAHPFEISTIQRAEEHFFVELTPKAPLRMKRHGTILLGLDQHSQEMGEVELTVTASGSGLSQGYQFTSVAPGGKIVFSPNLLIGELIKSVRISWEARAEAGLPGAPAIQSASYYPLAVKRGE